MVPANLLPDANALRNLVVFLGAAAIFGGVLVLSYLRVEVLYGSNDGPAPESKTNCPDCGARVPEDDEPCEYCGERLETGSGPDTGFRVASRS